MTIRPNLPAEDSPKPGSRLPLGALILWFLVVASVPVVLRMTPSAWDVEVYHAAMRSLAAGRDPYADAMAIQRAYHALAVRPGGDPPYSYVYSPITLPIVRLLTLLPLRLTAILYWSVFCLGVLAELWAGIQFADRSNLAERRFLQYAAPVSVFFTGLLANGIVLGGNIAYILYGAVLLCAFLGWRRHRWLPFYLAVLLASCVKAPLLGLVAIPFFSEPKQWKPVGATIVAGVGLFAATPLLWPVLFKHYLEAVELQFSFNHDFGCSPAGLLSDLLIAHGIPYSVPALVVYLLYALTILAVLRSLSRRFFAGVLSLQQFAPVLLLGTILLNPRVLEYDLAAITLPVALLARRLCARLWAGERSTLSFAVLFVLANGAALFGWQEWKTTAGILLAGCFIAGCLELHAGSAPVGKSEGRAVEPELHEA